MKKSISFLAIVLIICLLICICTSCIFKDYATAETENLFKKATFTNLDGSKTSLSKKHSSNEGIILTVNNPIKINTIVLGEKNSGLKSNITKFDLYYNSSSNEWVKFYSQDLVEEYRYCVFPELTTNKIKLMVTETQDNRKWNLKKFTGHFIEKTAQSDFRVMGYATKGFAKDGIKDTNIFNVVTHINLFDHMYLRSNGSITFKINSQDKDGNPIVIDQEPNFATELQNVINAIGNRNTKIIVTILPAKDEGLDPEALHTPAFKDHSDTVINDVNALLTKYPAIDGVAFDYEYPYTHKANTIFGKFVKNLKTSLPEGKMLALALSSWQFKPGLFPHDALEFVDMVEMMAYDIPYDERGYHSTFQNGIVNIVNELTSLGLKKHLPKINIGVPFYSRPVDLSAYWGDYKLDESVIGYNNNIIYKPAGDRYCGAVIDWADPSKTKQIKFPLYYNSPQMIYDKTAYAIDNNLGGIMIWHLGCDVEMSKSNSLVKAIGDAIANRS